MLARGVFNKIIMLLVQGMSFFALPLIAKKVGNTELSIWSVSYGFVQLVVPYIILQLDGAFTRFMSGQADNKVLFQRFFSLLVPIAVMSVFFYIVLHVYSSEFSYYLYKDYQYKSLISLIALWIGIRGMLVYVRNFFRTRGKFHLDTLISVIQQVSLLSAIFYISYYSKQINDLFFAALIVDTLLTVIFIRIIIKDVGFHQFKFYIPSEVWAYSLPLIPVTTLSWAINYCDQLFNVHYLGHEMNARYSLYYLYARLPHWIVVTPLHYSLFPFISKFEYKPENYAKIHDYIKKCVDASMIMISVFLSGVILFGSEIIYYLGGQEINAGGVLLLYIVGVSVFCTAFYQIVYHLISLSKNTYYLIYIFGSGAVVNLVLNFFLIKPFGILGAGLSTVISYLIVSFMLYMFVSISISKILSMKTLLSILGLLSAVLFLKLNVLNCSAINAFLICSLVWFGYVFILLFYTRKNHPYYFEYLSDLLCKVTGYLKHKSGNA